MDLTGKCLGCGVQLFARPHHATGLGGDPKIMQMLKVHSLIFPKKLKILRLNRSEIVINTNLHEA
jgi:hypothetical protein